MTHGRSHNSAIVALVAGSLGAADGRGASPRSADRSHIAAPSASAEKQITAVGLESRNARSRRHVELLQGISRSGIDSPQITLITFPGAVPEFAFDPGNPRNKAIGFDGAKYRPSLGIDLMDFPFPILPHPERPLGPRKPRISAATGRWDRGKHSTGLRIDLLDVILDDLKQVLTVEGRSCMRGDIDRAHSFPAHRIEGVELGSRGYPNVLTVKGNAVHVVYT